LANWGNGSAISQQGYFGLLGSRVMRVFPLAIVAVMAFALLVPGSAQASVIAEDEQTDQGNIDDYFGPSLCTPTFCLACLLLGQLTCINGYEVITCQTDPVNPNLCLCTIVCSTAAVDRLFVGSSR
jgi:hypothetical protein